MALDTIICDHLRYETLSMTIVCQLKIVLEPGTNELYVHIVSVNGYSFTDNISRGKSFQSMCCEFSYPIPRV